MIESNRVSKIKSVSSSRYPVFWGAIMMAGFVVAMSNIGDIVCVSADCAAGALIAISIVLSIIDDIKTTRSLNEFMANMSEKENKR